MFETRARSASATRQPGSFGGLRNLHAFDASPWSAFPIGAPTRQFNPGTHHRRFSQSDKAARLW
jgi:hypothetical protein